MSAPELGPARGGSGHRSPGAALPLPSRGASGTCSPGWAAGGGSGRHRPAVPLGGGGGSVPQAPLGVPDWRRCRQAAPHLSAAGGPAVRGWRGGWVGPPDLPYTAAAHLLGPRPAGNKEKRRAAAPWRPFPSSPAEPRAVGRPCANLSSATWVGWPGRVGAGLRRCAWLVGGVNNLTKARDEQRVGRGCAGSAARCGGLQRGSKSCPDSCLECMAYSEL